MWSLSWWLGSLSPGHPSGLWGCRYTPHQGSGQISQCCQNQRWPHGEPLHLGLGAHQAAEKKQSFLFSLKHSYPMELPSFCLGTQHGSISSIPTTNPVTCFRYPELKLSSSVPLAVISPPTHNEERGKGTWHFGFSYLETNSWGRCPGDDDWSLSHFCVKRRNGANRLICEEN